MLVEIKKAQVNDLKFIQQLNLNLFKKEKKEFDSTLNCNFTSSKAGKSYFLNKITKECLLIAIVNHKIIGYLAGGIKEVETYRKNSKMAELENMLILPEYRNQKIGTKLYQEFVAWCKSKKVKIISVTASAKNIKGIKFYKMNGFKEYNLVLERKI